MYFSQFEQVFLVSHAFMLFLMHDSAQNFQSEHFDCAREFAFRKSDILVLECKVPLDGFYEYVALISNISLMVAHLEHIVSNFVFSSQ